LSIRWLGGVCRCYEYADERDGNSHNGCQPAEQASALCHDRDVGP